MRTTRGRRSTMPSETNPDPDPFHDFDEEEYLAPNPDVGDGVAPGDLPSGLYHYRRWGQREARRGIGQRMQARLTRQLRPPPGFSFSSLNLTVSLGENM